LAREYTHNPVYELHTYAHPEEKGGMICERKWPFAFLLRGKSGKCGKRRKNIVLSS